MRLVRLQHVPALVAAARRSCCYDQRKRWGQEKLATGSSWGTPGLGYAAKWLSRLMAQAQETRGCVGPAAGRRQADSQGLHVNWAPENIQKVWATADGCARERGGRGECVASCMLMPCSR